MSNDKPPSDFLEFFLSISEGHDLLRALSFARSHIVDSTLSARFAGLHERLLKAFRLHDGLDDEGDFN